MAVSLKCECEFGNRGAFDCQRRQSSYSSCAYGFNSTSGHTLNGTVLYWTLSSPIEGVVRVRIEHFRGTVNRMPKIPLTIEGDAPVQIMESDNEVILKTGGLVARLNRRPWQLSFEREDGTALTNSAERAGAYVKRDGEAYIREQLSLGVGENVYGLGERFTAFIKNGQVVENVNKDGGTSSEQAYKWCNFQWDPAMSPDPEGILRRLHERGLRVCLWINLYIAQRSPLFEEGRRHGFCLRVLQS